MYIISFISVISMFGETCHYLWGIWTLNPIFIVYIIYIYYKYRNYFYIKSPLVSHGVGESFFSEMTEITEMFRRFR